MSGPYAFSPNRYESDLSNEVLYVLVGQEAEKISEVKVADLEKIVLKIKLDSKTWVSGSSKTIFFFKPPTLIFSNSTVL